MWQKYLLICVGVLLLFVSGQEAPIVSTSQGLVRGLASDDGYYMYLGIPYGVVDPTNPFGFSSPHPSFDAIFDAIDDSAMCPQREEFNNTLTGSLDCLHLSVFIPNSNDSPKAVLVWIFGGIFRIGFYGRYLFGPKYLVRHDIILVTMNYRLGPYGFMCTSDSKVPGNQGMKDQELALKWVKDNIERFNGDPNRITIAGNSAGSMAIDMHIMRNNQERSFQQVIMQSGTALAPTFFYPEKNAPVILARYFGLNTEDIQTALEFLANINELEVISAVEELQLSFRPCIEEVFEGVEPFLNHNWLTNDTLPLVKDLNIIVGVNEEEGLGLYNRDSNFENVVRNILTNAFDVDDEEFSEDETRLFYFGDEEFNFEILQGARDLRGDMTYNHPLVRTADRFLKNYAKKIFLYVFSYVGGRNFLRLKSNITDGGAGHADEQGYLFDISYMETPTTEDQLVLDRMTTLWANFVKYGDPTPEVSNLLPVKWEPITHSAYNYMDIGADLIPGRRPFHERMAFWDLLFEKYEHLQRFLLDYGHNMNLK